MGLSVNKKFETGQSPVGHMSGYCVSDGAAATGKKYVVGFSPRIIRFKNITDLVFYEWFLGMDSPAALKTVATGRITLEAAEGITAEEDGFTIPASILLASKTFVWEAVG